MSVVCCLCDELITHPEESYRLWCVVVCDLESSRMRRPWPTGAIAPNKKKSVYDYLQRSVVQPFTDTNLAVTTSQLHAVVKLMLSDRTKTVSYIIWRVVCDLLK